MYIMAVKPTIPMEYVLALTRAELRCGALVRLRDWPRGAAFTRRELSTLGWHTGMLVALERRGMLVRSVACRVLVWRRPMVDRGPTSR